MKSLHLLGASTNPSDLISVLHLDNRSDAHSPSSANGPREGAIVERSILGQCSSSSNKGAKLGRLIEPSMFGMVAASAGNIALNADIVLSLSHPL